MKAALHADEWYPVWSLSTSKRDITDARRGAERFPSQYAVVDADAELLARYKAAYAEWSAVQKILHGLCQRGTA